ncbi:(2Fe-2S)-binding protein, partial [Vibrio vulnificus]
MPKIRINKLHSIESNRANTILETMEQAGLLPEYNCRDGHCGA